MDIPKLIEELIRDECRNGKPSLKPYRDSRGIETIGIGRNLRDTGISDEEARMMCANDIIRAVEALDKFVPWWQKLDEVRQRVLTNMAFNLGVAPNNPPGKRGLADFHATLGFMADGNYEEAALEMLESEWARQVGVRALRLSHMMATGSDDVRHIPERSET